MADDAIEVLHGLLSRAQVASLGVREAEGPMVSQVGFVALHDPVTLALLVSDLSPHTAALRADPRCGVLVSDPPVEGDPRSNHALPRLAFLADARFVTRAEAAAMGLDAQYKQKYAIAERLLGLGDFHIVVLTPVEGSARLVVGFGRAYTVTGPAMRTLHHQTA